MDLTGFLFGNVDENGELADEGILDKVCLPMYTYSRSTGATFLT